MRPDELLIIADPLRTYRWSADDRLVEVALVDQAGEPRVSYAYDHLGTRVAGSALPVDGETPAPQRRALRYLQDYQNPTGYSQSVGEVDAATGEVLAARLFDEEGAVGELRRHDPSSQSFELSYLHGDHLSTTRLLTDSVGGLSGAGVVSYEPFGTVASGGGLGSLTSYGFTGQYREAALGMQYHRARWLQTSLGRWGSEDPVWDWPENFGNSWNYCGALPISRVDLSGGFSAMELLITLAITTTLGGIAGALIGAAYGFIYGDIAGNMKKGAIIGGVAGLVIGLALFFGPTGFVVAANAGNTKVLIALLIAFAGLYMALLMLANVLYMRTATPAQVARLRNALLTSIPEGADKRRILAFFDRKIAGNMKIFDEPSMPVWMYSYLGELRVNLTTLELPDDKLASMLVHEMVHLSGSGVQTGSNSLNILGGEKLKKEMEEDASAVQVYFEEKILNSGGGSGKGTGRDHLTQLIEVLPYAEKGSKHEFEQKFNRNPGYGQQRFYEIFGAD